jgi:hypothetical protein
MYINKIIEGMWMRKEEEMFMYDSHRRGRVSEEFELLHIQLMLSFTK